ncbi:MAG: hypothetical protein Q4A71_07170 [Actinomycetaceae bacterium]|nr:hypothetical protein [Actinomycetaceae bacterium]
MKHTHQTMWNEPTQAARVTVAQGDICAADKGSAHTENNPNMPCRWRKVAATIGALAVVAVGALGINNINANATENNAAPTTHVVTGDTSGLNPADIDPARTSTLAVTKTEGNPYDDPAPGDQPNGSPAGATIKVQKVRQIDLKTANWGEIAKMTVEDATKLGLEDAATATTDTTGTAKFSGLPVGLYLVSDEPPADPAHKHTRIQPFLITLPVGASVKLGDENARKMWVYQAEISAKPLPAEPPAHMQKPTPKPKPKPAAPKRLSKTGVAISGLVLLSAAAISAGIVLAKRRREEDAETTVKVEA